MNRSQGLMLTAILAGISFALIWMGIENLYLRLVFALPLVLFLPGYSIQAASFDNPRLGTPERFVLSIGLSIAVVILTGLGLNATPWKLDTRLWALLLALVTWVAALVAAWKRYRRYGLSRSFLSLDNFATGINRQMRNLFKRDPRAGAVPRSEARRPGLRLLEVLLLGVSLVLAAFAVGVTRLPAPAENLEGYTLLWLIPLGDESQGVVNLGVQNMEVEPVQYRVELYAGSQAIQVWSDIHLEPQQKWEQNLGLPLENFGNQPITAWLYRQDQMDSIYRRVTLRRSIPEGQ